MAFDETLCDGCPIQGEFTPYRGVDGNEDAPYLIVTDLPSQAGARKGRMLPANQGKLLAKCLKDEEFDTADFRLVPMCRCPYNKDSYKTAFKKQINRHCRRHLEDYIDETKPAAIITLGADATGQVMNKNVKITKVRGLAHHSEEFGVPVFPMQSIAVAVNYPQNEPLLAADCASFGRLVDADLDIDTADAFTTGEYTLVKDLQFLIDMDPEILSFDTETTGLRWYQRGVDVRSYRKHLHEGKAWFQPRFQILTMQFTVEAGKSYVLAWDHPEDPIPEEDKPRLRNQLRQLLCAPNRIVVGQRLKFDNVALWMTEGIRFRIGGDTSMMAAIVDENLPEKNLDVLTKLFVKDMAGYADRFNQIVQKDRMWETTLDSLVPYGGGDTDAVFRLYHILEDKIASDEGLWTHYTQVSIPGLNAMARIETHGMYVDMEEAMPQFQAYMEEEVERQRLSLLSQLDRGLKRDVVRDFLSKSQNKNKSAEEALSFGRTDFLKEILFYHPKGFRLKPVVFTKTTDKLEDPNLKEPSTSSKDHLPFFFDTCPFTLELAQYVKDKRMLETNILGFQEKFVVDGMVRPTYYLDVTVTRRTASRDPNGQNFPKRGKKAKMYQKSFVAPRGWVIISCDLSQAELRIAGDMARDPEIIRIYNENGDIHITTACIVARISEEEFHRLPEEQKKDLRTKAKAVNFGFLYGMSWRKFIIYAKTQYGAVFTEQQAKRIRTDYFRRYKNLEVWHKRVRQIVQERGWIRSYSGLIRHLPTVWSHEEYIQAEAIRQGINSPVQEFGSTLGVMALGRMDEELDPEYIKLIGFVHDAIYAYVREEHVDWGLKTLKRYMETNPLEETFNLRMRIPIVADASFGWNQGEMFELSNFRLDEPYDFSTIQDKEGRQLFELPEQVAPANDGYLVGSPYTEPDEFEDENVVSIARVRRIRGASVSSTKKQGHRKGQAPVKVRFAEDSETAPATSRIRRSR
ncbi:DNA polymerase [Pseudomonas phage SM1]|uniref:Putative DNA polymerase I n=1 Tax=Pseudomonas phage SM1 TaxID=1772332 RepID=A0A0U3DE91_9CAUD|nr:DNA polymerase [Pseudomonas phage SM1]ALT58029.1 putative DNA polymerase I [Pseudomonas phage SM1]